MMMARHGDTSAPRTVGDPPPNSSNWNLPNALTALRIVMVPFFVWFLWAGGTHGADSMPMRWAAVVVFGVAMYTDKLDGDIARARNLITSFGKIADPIADKLLTGAAFVVLSMLGELWWWVTIVILVREWGAADGRPDRVAAAAGAPGGHLVAVVRVGADRTGADRHRGHRHRLRDQGRPTA